MDINEIEVGQKLWWSGRLRVAGLYIFPAQEVMVQGNDRSDNLPIAIVNKYGYECFVEPETLSALLEHEDA